MSSKDDTFTTLDLKSRYHHIKMDPVRRKFLDFEWPFKDGCIIYFQFCVLLFGLASACSVFAKVVQDITTYLNQELLTLKQLSKVAE